MKNLALWHAVWSVQKVILLLSYALHRVTVRGVTNVSWEVGAAEISSLVWNLTRTIPGARSTVLYANKYYPRKYDRQLPAITSKRRANALALVVGPWWLGQSLHRAEGILYVGALGYLVSSIDQRAWEMNFVRRKGLAIACFLTGTDIRSTAMSVEIELDRGCVHVGGILGRAYPWMATPEYEDSKRELARVINANSDAVFSLASAQASYLEPTFHPTVYAFPDDDFVADFTKFERAEPLRIVHAPSSPLLKGTAEVSQAIARLRAEGYEFDYTELTETSNARVLRELDRAHIVLNNFFSYTPGVFGVEALARGCVMLTSASESLEAGLPAGSDAAWIRTPSSQIYETLVALITHPETLRAQAERGFAFAQAHFSEQAARRQIVPILDAALAHRMST